MDADYPRDYGFDSFRDPDKEPEPGPDAKPDALLRRRESLGSPRTFRELRQLPGREDRRSALRPEDTDETPGYTDAKPEPLTDALSVPCLKCGQPYARVVFHSYGPADELAYCATFLHTDRESGTVACHSGEHA